MEKLNDDEISYLFKFVEKKFVRYYDVQVELVDHLASKIEELLFNQPNLFFEVALEKVYAGFGIFGFHNLLKERIAASYRQGRKLWWAERKGLFQWPELARTFCLAVVMYLIQFWVGGVIVGILGAVAVVVTSSTLLGLSRCKKPLSGMSFSNRIIDGYMFVVIQMVLNGFLHFTTIESYPAQAFMLFLMMSLSFVALTRVHLRMIKVQKIQYPEAFA